MTTPNFTAGQEAEGKVPALIAWALFGETLGVLALVGMGLAVAGVYLARGQA